jgi:hypothetical protein
MKKAIKLREEWESLRILLDVVRQREKRKLALLKLQQEVLMVPLFQCSELSIHFQIVEEEVVVGWRTVQKARVSVAAKWKVRPVKLQAVRAHHNFRNSSGRLVQTVLYSSCFDAFAAKRTKAMYLEPAVLLQPSVEMKCRHSQSLVLKATATQRLYHPQVVKVLLRRIPMRMTFRRVMHQQLHPTIPMQSGSFGLIQKSWRYFYSNSSSQHYGCH